MPLGVVAIVFAAQVNSKVAAGDIAGAMDSSKKAKMFSFIALGLGLLAVLFYIVWIVLIVGLSAAGNM
jgi:interferon-induced transmembrane protein